ncbi:MAG: efflux RND transporter periplasmic adaptor subunit [Gammaproteobacteria bacterium]
MNEHLGSIAFVALATMMVLLSTGCSRQDENAAARNAADVADRDDEQHGVLPFPAAEREAQGVRTVRVGPRQMAATVSAPGEVRTNAYRSSQITPRIQAQVVARHARLGDTVETGQPLVTLSSVQMAEAQGALIEADREWRRVRELGRGVVSEQRYIAAQVARQRSYATVRAYGMTADQVERLLEAGDATLATGEFELLSPQAGTVIHDDFVVGEVVEPGHVLFEISDESVLWVEARLSPEDAARIRIGSTATIGLTNGRRVEGEVIQRHHRLDETTRTQSVRIEVDNSEDLLHAGDYVEVSLPTSVFEARVAVPEEAVLLLDGVPTVFVVDGDEVHARPVETGATASGWTAIEAGLAPGDEVVTQGAFLIKSLMLKSQMGEGHAH